MAAAFRLSKVFSFVSRRCVPLIRSQTLRLVLGTSTVVRLRSTLHVDIEQCDINTPIPLSGIPDFDNEFLKTKDATTTLYEVTLGILVKTENECTQLIYKLINYYSDYMKFVGRLDEEGERLWCLIIDTRTEINDCKDKIQKLQMVLSSMDRLIMQLAEVAFMSGNEELSSEIHSSPLQMWQEADEAKERRLYASGLMNECIAKDILVTSDVEPRNDVSNASYKTEQVQDISKPKQPTNSDMDSIQK
ncbi:uncharacterized protein LOC106883317 isoform X1 [Octopus bimaculoides]|uniref:Direct IAP-binding protein with low pI n=2 Tax=Octopus bimaculoides TaxID=37653 RepID=A0A0L8FHI7_OCTBM|nr:uncharacterized protein LOC106883317 isoform X1 [Octopus bimaculoides]|eukprot:XP_014789768.1 PREDICTED: uncharacterized protein LOC106883317 isoform X1 [Octopus bimaculoides]